MTVKGFINGSKQMCGEYMTTLNDALVFGDRSGILEGEIPNILCLAPSRVRQFETKNIDKIMSHVGSTYYNGIDDRSVQQMRDVYVRASAHFGQYPYDVELFLDTGEHNLGAEGLFAPIRWRALETTFKVCDGRIRVVDVELWSSCNRILHTSVNGELVLILENKRFSVMDPPDDPELLTPFQY